jgi:hypothetical protein
MRKLTVRLHRAAGDAVAVGTLAEQDRRIYFEYDAAFPTTATTTPRTSRSRSMTRPVNGRSPPRMT